MPAWQRRCRQQRRRSAVGSRQSASAVQAWRSRFRRRRRSGGGSAELPAGSAGRHQAVRKRWRRSCSRATRVTARTGARQLLLPAPLLATCLRTRDRRAECATQCTAAVEGQLLFKSLCVLLQRHGISASLTSSLSSSRKAAQVLCGHGVGTSLCSFALPHDR